MSVTNPHPARNSYGETNDRHAMSAKPSPPSADGDQVLANHEADQEDPLRIVKFIAGVLERAHTTAMSGNNTDEARAIFHIAMSFAEEFETGTPDVRPPALP